MDDAPANPKPFRLQQGDAFGFSDDGEQVGVTWPNFGDPEPEDAAACTGFDSDQFLDLLITGAHDSNEIGQRVLILAMLQKRPCAPGSLTAFALWANMPRTTARRKWTGILQHLRACYAELRPPAAHG